MKTADLPGSVKFTNGLTAVRLDHYEDAFEDAAPYRIELSGFNDPIVWIPMPDLLRWKQEKEAQQ